MGIKVHISLPRVTIMNKGRSMLMPSALLSVAMVIGLTQFAPQLMDLWMGLASTVRPLASTVRPPHK